MKLETFFEKFDLFADAPDAVDKMRELVLELAVQGMVANQDPKDEPAVKLLQRLVAFKLANPLSGRSGRSKEEPVDNQLNSEGLLPANWVSTTIGEVLYVIRGASPRPKGDPQYFSETRTPYHWVKISDIRKHGQNGLLMDTDEFLTEAGMRKSVLLPKGTLVLTNSATIGVPIVLGIEGCCIHDGYLAFPNFPHDLLSQKFLLYLFHALKKHAERNARGLAQLNLNTELVRSFPFGLPPLAEQKRIVAKVDELMALCDRLEAQQQERETRHAALARASLARFADAPTPANLNFIFHPSYTISPADLRKSILTLAVQGKLVPQDPNDEPAEEIVRRAEADRPNVVESPIDEAELPWSLPSYWTWVRLGEIANIKHGYAFRSESFTSEATPYVLTTPGNFYESGGFRDRGANTKYFNGEVPSSFVFNAGDLIIPMTEQAAGLLGSPAFIPDDGKTYLHNQRLGKLEFYSCEVLPSYVFWFFNDDFFRGELARTCTGMKVRHTSPKRILKVPFALPPLAEQRRIVDKVDQLMASVDALEAQLAASRATAANLLSALVAQLTGTPNNRYVSVSSATGSGRRGRPKKSS